MSKNCKKNLEFIMTNVFDCINSWDKKNTKSIEEKRKFFLADLK